MFDCKSFVNIKEFPNYAKLSDAILLGKFVFITSLQHKVNLPTSLRVIYLE